MNKTIDFKFIGGLFVGAVLIGGIVVLLMGGAEDRRSSGVSQSGPLRPDVSADASGQTPGEDEGGPEEDDQDEFTPAQLPPDIAVPDGKGKVTCPGPTQKVGTAEQLTEALAAARPGDVIQLEPGVYGGRFVAGTPGTKDKPIFVCGGPDAIIDGGGVKEGYAFHLSKVSHWRLVGFTVRNSQKGVMTDTTTDSVIQGLTVHDIGDEAIHLRNSSSRNTVQYNKIYNTGLRREKFGEGVYLGTAESNWEQTSGGQMDKSDDNVVRGNVIRATAEAIDVKEGTSGGHIVGNVFDGSTLGGSKHNDSWVDVKGNDYVIEGNRGSKTNEDGFQTHEIVKGWGTRNVFRGNVIDLGGSGGVGVNDTVGGNTIACDNKVTGGRLTKKGGCS